MMIHGGNTIEKIVCKFNQSDDGGLITHRNPRKEGNWKSVKNRKVTMMKKEKKDIYQIITNEIIRGLKNDIIPWEKCWVTRSNAPQNYKGKIYRGINNLLLSLMSLMSEYNDPRWLTYGQARKLDGNIKKGEKASPIVLWLPTYSHDPKTCKKAFNEYCGFTAPFGSCTVRITTRHWTVFNLEQCENVNLPKMEEPVVSEYSPIEQAETIIREYIKRENILTVSTQRAYYRPKEDTISMPSHNAFKSNEEYYDTYFHEMGHSTGHSSRLDRKKTDSEEVHYSSELYAEEELIAEMTAGFLSATVGIDTAKTKEQRKAYIQNWLTRLQDDKSLVIVSAQKAQKATRFILGEE